MTEDQSVLGRRRIYYDQTGGEALICSDSEEEAIDDDEEKREFVDSEDYILRLVVLSDAVIQSMFSFFFHLYLESSFYCNSKHHISFPYCKFTTPYKRVIGKRIFQILFTRFIPPTPRKW